MPIPKTSQTTIRRNANLKSWERGEAYYRNGAVAAITQRGNILQAEVEGSELDPYRVTLSFDDGGFTSIACTCPYSFDGWCKHIVATMLVCLHEPEIIEKRPTLKQLLDGLDLVQTQQLLQRLVEKYPELIDAVDSEVSFLANPALTKKSATSPRRTTVDKAPFRREAEQILRDAMHGWEEGWYEEEDTISHELIELIAKAEKFTEEGDARNALVILEGITEGCADRWHEVEEYRDDSYEIVSLLDQAWAEAILSIELTTEERIDIQVNLESWQDGFSSEFNISSEALRQGWDYPPLQRVLEGKISEFRILQEAAPAYTDELAEIRLRILERQERYQEYLYLAEAERQTQAYLTMLGRLGRVAEAMEAAETQMTSMEQAKALAEILREQGALLEALQVARSGLTLRGYCQYELANWASELAEGLGYRQVTLHTRTLAFQARPSFADYQKIEELAGANWQAAKAKVLEELRTNEDWDAKGAKVDIFLHEGLIEDAIATVADIRSYDSRLVHRVMDEAINSHPDWVVSNAIPRAESIINPGKARDYDYAIEWLKKARAACLAGGRQPEWSAYRAELIETHGRKYKLMGLFKEAGL